MQGVIFDIKRFATHDGPGIRTTVFVKGCPICCAWCQNPEGLSMQIDLWHFAAKCLRCGRCVAACPHTAIALDAGANRPIRIDRERCTRCGACVTACPAEAIVFDGRAVDSAEVVAEVLADRVFYETSGGGATLSGGEPLAQPEFCLEILRACRDADIHCAVETCLSVPAEVLDRFLPATALFICDLKLMDPDLHRRWTGKDNRRVVENFRRTVAAGAEVLVRVPLAPGVTATPENVGAIAAFLRETAPSVPVELINFNPLARAKYRRMEKAYPFAEAGPLSGKELRRLQEIVADAGLTCVGMEGGEGA